MGEWLAPFAAGAVLAVLLAAVDGWWNRRRGRGWWEAPVLLHVGTFYIAAWLMAAAWWGSLWWAILIAPALMAAYIVCGVAIGVVVGRIKRRRAS